MILGQVKLDRAISRALVVLWVVVSSILASGQELVDFERPLAMCSTPFENAPALSVLASDNEFVFIKNSDKLSALNARTLRTEWTTPLPYSRMIKAIVDKGYLVIITNNETGATVFSINIVTGLPQSSLSGIPIQKASIPGILNFEPAGKYLAYDDSGKIAFLNSDLTTVLWSRDFGKILLGVNSAGEFLDLIFEEEILRIAPETGNTIGRILLTEKLSVVGRSDKGEVFLGMQKGEVVSRKSFESEQAWSIRTGGRVTSLHTVGNGLLATSYDNFAYFLFQDDGRLLWKKRLGARIIFEPTLYRDIVVLTNSLEGTMLLVKLSDGRTLNKLATPANLPFTGKAHVVGGRVFITSTQGLLVFSPNGCK